MFCQLLVVAAVAAIVASSDLPPSCSKPVFCDSELLHHVQTQRVFADSKTFVDLQLRQDANTTLAAFQQLLDATNNNPTKEQVTEFVDSHFDKTSELEEWTPTDYSTNPMFLLSIRDRTLRKFGKDINDIWPTLGRKIKPIVFEKPDQFSLIPVDHGFIIPGGRFKEIYYWDTYWIIEGLLISGMRTTARGMIENLFELVKKIGHVPNGSRWYYEQRSQPPLLTAMVNLYLRYTFDMKFLKDNINYLETELEYWLKTQTVTFEKGDNSYTLLRYFAESGGPRPESYFEDYNNSLVFDTEERRTDFYVDIKSAAESGWDFSSRWFLDENGSNTGHLTNIHTRNIIPVDLNSIFAKALHNVAYFQALLGNRRKAMYWSQLSNQWKSNIEEVFWNEEDGIWYDYDIFNNFHRRFFYPSNVAPLWMGVVDKKKIKKHSAQVLKYLRDSNGLDFPGGVPTSLNYTGEQWDFPNAWPPLVSIVVNALEALETEEARKLAFNVAQNWVRANLKGFTDTKKMFEKYDSAQPGKIGLGGEYDPQTGFGWSNGVVLEFLTKYGRSLTATDSLSERLSDDDSSSILADLEIDDTYVSE